LAPHRRPKEEGRAQLFFDFPARLGYKLAGRNLLDHNGKGVPSGRFSRPKPGVNSAMEEQIRNYQKILKGNPLDAPAFTALEELYKGADKWRELTDLYEDRIRHAGDPEQEKALLGKCAIVWHRRIGDVNKALECFSRLQRVDPADRTALEGLADIHAAKNEWRRLSDDLERLAVQTEDSVARADLYMRLGNLSPGQLKRKGSGLWQTCC